MTNRHVNVAIVKTLAIRRMLPALDVDIATGNLIQSRETLDSIDRLYKQLGTALDSIRKDLK